MPALFQALLRLRFQSSFTVDNRAKPSSVAGYNVTWARFLDQNKSGMRAPPTSIIVVARVANRFPLLTSNSTSPKDYVDLAWTP